MVLPSASRNAGGLFPVARRLTEELNRVGTVQLEVIGLRDEFSEADRPLWGQLPLRLCRPRGPKVLGYSPDYLPAFLAAQADLIHQHGIWTLMGREVSRFARQTGRPYLLTAHGMIEPWAFQHSRLKKRLALWWYQKANIEEAAVVSVNSEREADFMRKLGFRSPIAILPNGVDPVEAKGGAPAFRHSVPEGRCALLFLGRIHPKKGVRELIIGFARAREQDANFARTWSLVIAGWDDGGHEAALRDLAVQVGLKEPELCWAGPVFGDTKNATLCASSAFILPSFGEGMPVAALEALAAGLPVLLTPECNLPAALERNAGLSISTSAEGVCDGLLRLQRFTPDERRGMGERGAELARSRYSWPRIAADLERLYAWCLGQGPRPSDLLF